MADRKITDLASINNSDIADGDLIHVIDSGAAAADKNKSMEFSELDVRYYRSGYATPSTTYASDGDDNYIAATTAGGAFTVTLATAAGVAGKMLKVIKTNSDLNKLTIDGNGSETIGGAASIFLLGHDESVTLVSNGSNWQIINWDEGRDVVTTNTWGETNNIDINQLTYTFKRESLIIKESITTWTGSAGTTASAAWVLPGSLTIDTTRRAGAGTSVLNQEANKYGDATYFTTGWVAAGVFYYTSTQVRFSAGGSTLLFSNLTAADSVRFSPNVEIPIA